MEKIIFQQEGETPAAFYVLEQTMVAGNTYILVTDTEEGDGEALILRELPQTEEKESVYEAVTEETELSAVAGVFANILEDVELTNDFD